MILQIIAAGLLTLQSTTPLLEEPVRPRNEVGQIDGSRTEIAVLGTPHLSSIDGFDPVWADAVVSRLADWQPDLVLIEQLPAPEIEMMRADADYSDVIAQFAARTIEISDEALISLDITRSEARNALETPLPEMPSPEQQRERAALFLANMEPTSALVQWQRLPAAERRVGDGLTETLVEQLETEAARINETTLFAAAIANATGLDRIHPFDSHAEKRAFLSDIDVVMQAFQASRVMQDVMQGEAAAALRAATVGIDSADALLAVLRRVNGPGHQRLDIAVQWTSFTSADMNGLGRQRVAYWESRNLRMAANIREITARYPGARVLVIVGSAHKPYLDDLLGRAMDVALVDTVGLLE
ncbi:DUF5694 domain-containing protein [uncultured Maricaulis sp.]|uniref:DUF5694 domain-containing protein n=1 Tax=uncultured Maricaulis sp. TaxID=174710 RepID=UPI00261C6099|nr:DUF5694 domain-containing protein [uncultured Maricaulis sp.]